MRNYPIQKIVIKNGDVFQIRHLSNGDESALFDFYSQVAKETKHTLVCPEKLSSLERLQEKIEQSEKSFSELYLGVFHDSNIVASLRFRVTIPDHPWAKHVGEFGMIVLQKYWNQGIGKKLLKVMEEHALQIGIHRIEAKVRSNNPIAITLYQNSGYKIEGVRQKGAFIDGQFIDELFIAKLL